MNFNMNGELHNFCKSGLSKLRTIQTLLFACLPTEPHAHNGEAMYAVTLGMRLKKFDEKHRLFTLFYTCPLATFGQNASPKN